ncbi:UNKNOWN [Stylonychia lemnae]|uniref:Uncharacterized protein n=1 Tax=Stylonychia lemnae TaxID=5949 RepID=A0A078B353_STYLE|nr:UNKNOWN [Stylonychia lemnae]|eukprot:CDW88874.1 UNKNOWN [Stylonychia lemnae]
MYQQAGGYQAVYSFNSNDLSENFSDKWRLYTFSFQSKIVKQNDQAYLRILIDGVLMNEIQIQNQVTLDMYPVSKDLCVIGNSQKADEFLRSSLHPDIRYVKFLQTHRTQENYNFYINSYPQAKRANIALYFKLDDKNIFNYDYYENPQVYYYQDQYEEHDKSWKCNTTHLKVMNIQKGVNIFTGLELRTTDDLQNGFYMDFWINIQQDLEDSTNKKRVIFTADKLIRVKTLKKNILLQIGNSANDIVLNQSYIYYRKWSYFAISILSNKTVEVFQDGSKISTFQYQEDQLSTFSGSQSSITGSFLSNIYRLSFSNSNFILSDNLCGEESLFLKVQNSQDTYQGACKDNNYLPKFQSITNQQGQTNSLFQAQLRTAYKFMTIEFWFFYERNPSSNSSYIYSFLKQFNAEERLKVEIIFNTSSNLDNLVIGLYDTVNANLNFNQSIQEQNWYHLAITANSQQIGTVAYLFDPFSQNTQKLTSRASITQPNTPLSKTFLGGDMKGNKRFVGSLQEFRIWLEYRTLSKIEKYRNLEISNDNQRNQLTHYYKFSCSTSYNRIENLISYQNDDKSTYDFTIQNTLAVDSPIRYEKFGDNTVFKIKCQLVQYSIVCSE